MLGFKDSGAQQRFRIQPSDCSGSNCFSRSELRVERFRSSYRGYIVMQKAFRSKRDFRVMAAMPQRTASWMEEVLEKMEASSHVIPLLHKYPVRTDTKNMWEDGKVMLGFAVHSEDARRFWREGCPGIALSSA
jgi:hypothetical protein